MLYLGSPLLGVSENDQFHGKVEGQVDVILRVEQLTCPLFCNQYHCGCPCGEDCEHTLSVIVDTIATENTITDDNTIVLLMIILRTDIYPHRSIMLIFAGTRYGLPAMLPISILFALGWTSLFPRKYHNISISILVLILFVISTYIILGVQIPFYNCTIDPPIRCLYP